MTSGLPLLAALGVLAVAAVPVSETAWAWIMRTRAARRSAATGSSAFGPPKIAARVCVGLSCACALAAAGALWLSRQHLETTSGVADPLPWGALWIYALVLVVEWRLVGTRDAGRRALTGMLLAGVGVLFLGIGLGAWTGTAASAQPACPPGMSAEVLYAWRLTAVAALGLVLVPLAGIVLGFNRAEAPPLSAAPASVAVAAWLEPALPALGWLPVSAGSGAALAALLVFALLVLGLACSRGSRATLGGLFVCFALGVGGSILLALQMEGCAE